MRIRLGLGFRQRNGLKADSGTDLEAGAGSDTGKGAKARAGSNSGSAAMSEGKGPKSLTEGDFGARRRAERDFVGGTETDVAEARIDWVTEFSPSLRSHSTLRENALALPERIVRGCASADVSPSSSKESRIEQNRTEQNRTEQNRTGRLHSNN